MLDAMSWMGITLGTAGDDVKSWSLGAFPTGKEEPSILLDKGSSGVGSK